MSIALIIVESPNKAKKIESMFPGLYSAIATVGHICDLPQNPKVGVGIDRESLKGDYALTQNKNRHTDGERAIGKIQDFLKKHPGIQIYLATDDDREGESIAAFVLQYLRLPLSTPRVRFNAITKDKIELAIANAGKVDWDIVQSREARRLIDRIIGYTVSPILQNSTKQGKAAAGRVQTAVEALVIERERKIKSHIPQKYYSVRMDLDGWHADWQPPSELKPPVRPKPNSEYDSDGEKTYCLNSAIAEKIAKFTNLIVFSCEENQEFRLPPSPLYTISMIQMANKLFGWTALKTMQVAQKLFEGDGSGYGHITYHRTDNPNIDLLAAEEIRDWLRLQGYPVSESPNKWPVKDKLAQEAHEAIRPTYFLTELAGNDEDQRRLYQLIRERTIYSQLSPALYAVYKTVLTDPVLQKEMFIANSRSLLEPGWLVTKMAKSDSLSEIEEDVADETQLITLPKLKPGSLVNVKQAVVKPHTTRSAPRYTLNTLTSKLEKLSIGRPATIASILQNIQDKGNIQIKLNGQLIPVAVAETCYDLLYPNFGFAHIGYTAELEKALDMIAKGEIDGTMLIKNVWDRLENECKLISKK